jgi:uncharacterized protein (TIGR02145 family)
MPPKHLAIAILLLAFTAHSGDNTRTYGGQTYKTAKIGTQTWFAENLNYEAEGSVCYGNNPANCAKYGRLYKWRLAMKVCPEGWHLPSNAEWDELYRFVDGNKGTESPYNSKMAGKHLKAISGWNDDGNGTDAHGFSALPGGYGNPNGDFINFINVGNYGYWWSASEDRYDAYSRLMGYNRESARWLNDNKNNLFSVRCVKD